MKKFLILILTALVTVAADAQIFTHKMIKDKFDDVVSEREIKTLIEKNDTAIIIEEKGNEPVTYITPYYLEMPSVGSKDDIVRIVDNVYGYEKSWGVILEKDFKDYQSALSNEEDVSKLIEKYYYFITHRVVTDKYGLQFLSEHYWIEKIDKSENDKRTIYSIIY